MNLAVSPVSHPGDARRRQLAGVTADFPPPAARPLPSWLRSVVAGRAGSAALAEDVLQEVALAEATAPPDTLPPPDARGPWLYRVAVRQTALALRTAGRRRVREHRAAAPDECSAPPPLAALLHAETADLLTMALADLPPGDRDVLTLKYVEGLTYAQAADRLGVSVHCVEDRLRRGRDRLRRALARRGVREP